MKKAILSAVAASGLIACTSVESTVVSSAEIAASVDGNPIAVIQANALGLTALLHRIDIVQSDLDTVINRLLVSEAKSMGATRVQVLNARTTPRRGLYALTGVFPFVVIGVTESQAVGVAIKKAVAPTPPVAGEPPGDSGALRDSCPHSPPPAPCAPDSSPSSSCSCSPAAPAPERSPPPSSPR